MQCDMAPCGVGGVTGTCSASCELLISAALRRWELIIVARFKPCAEAVRSFVCSNASRAASAASVGEKVEGWDAGVLLMAGGICRTRGASSALAAGWSEIRLRLSCTAFNFAELPGKEKCGHGEVWAW